ncbi:MAG TPA: methyltransferase domain-containing protein [Micavibrio sp.]|nr:methyltransferase domain-containing protein [Micavibrio sp.]
MTPSAYHLRDFYKTLGGRIVRRLLREELLRLWPEAQGLRVLGGGYAVPYLKLYAEQSERTVAVMFSGQGVHYWPADGKNLAAIAHETDLPFETNSIDRILLIHSLEFTGFLKPAFEELWRVLKSNGRILVVVPNRMGLWARADWTPFGHGTPYSAGQVEDFLRGNLFIPERTGRALFIPPFKSQMLLRSAGLWEKVGKALCPAMGGMIFVEASKQIYAGMGKPVRALSPTPVKVRPVTEGAPEPT